MAYVKGQPFKPQSEDVDGNPLALGSIEFFLWNTTTPTPYYTDSNGTSGGTSLTLNLLGKPANDIFFSDTVEYKLVLKDSSGSVIDTLGPYTPPLVATNFANTSNIAQGDALIGVKSPLAGAIARTQHDKNADIVSINDFDVDPTGVNDSTAGIQAAINSCSKANGGKLTAKAGIYKITSSLVIPWDMYFFELSASWSTLFFLAGSTAFDMFTISNPGAGFLAVNQCKINNIRLSGSSLSGGGALINTSNASAMEIDHVLFQNLSETGSGIYVAGNGADYSHDIQMRNIYFDTTTGHSFINFASTSSDSMVKGIFGNGRFGCLYAIFIDDGASNIQFTDGHIYNTVEPVLAVSANGGSLMFDNMMFDNGLSHIVDLNGATNCTFDNCKFMFAPTGFSNLRLFDSSGNNFNNCTFDGGLSAALAINELGTSNNNRFNESTLMGSYTTSPPIVLAGSNSNYRAQGIDHILTGTGTITGGATIFIGQGYGSTSETLAQAITPSNGYIRKLKLQSDITPGSGQTYTATVRVNGADTAITGQIVNGSFSSYSNAMLAVSENDVVTIRVVASASAAAASIRTSLVINL